MNFDEAIKAHSAWKMKLSAYISKPDGTLNPSEIQPDNRCDLGKWIYGEGKRFSHLPEYSALQLQHAEFHKAAAQVVQKADNGQNMTDEIALGGKSAFAQASSSVVSAIMAMKRKAGG